MNKFEIGQRVIIQNKERTVDYNGISGTVVGVEDLDYTFYHCVHLDRIPETRKFKGKMYLYFASDELEAIEDEPIEKQVEHIIEEQEAEEIRHAKLSNEEIALELVKAWAGQSGRPASFSLVIECYQRALKDLAEAQNQAKTGESNSNDKIKCKGKKEPQGAK